jgi:hypothetical protein
MCGVQRCLAAWLLGVALAFTLLSSPGATRVLKFSLSSVTVVNDKGAT